MNALRFFRDNAPWLSAAGLMLFVSSPGQTFFISLFALEIRAEFNLSHGEWGGLYTIGTICSAIVMLWAGGLADRLRARALAALAAAGLAATCVAMANVNSVWMLGFVLFALRFCGQGMLSHASVVSVGRWFQATRGRALAFSALGFALAEAVLPITYVALALLLGWRMSWVIAGAMTLAAIPLFFLLLRRERRPSGDPDAVRSTGMLGRHWTRRDALGHWLFWAVLPGLLCMSSFGTALFFQQAQLVSEKGWALAAFAGLYPFYVVASLCAVFATGWALDRWGSRRILPLHLLPMATGFILLSICEGVGLAAIGMALIGATAGMGNAVIGAFWPEFYGTARLGAIRAIGASVSVFASATGPGVTGWFLDRGVSFETELLAMSAIALAISVMLWVAMRRAPALSAA
jgi:sugar phosphate permease